MEILTFILIGAGILVAIILFTLTKEWIVIYNKFVYWRTRTDRKFADIDVVMQQRIDMLPALAQIVKKYDIHEYKALKDVIEARSRWTKDASISEKVQAVQEIDNSFLKIQAVFEKYPQLKAEALHKSILGKGSISKMESKLSKFRLEYNRVTQKYNKRVQIFPRNIVAKVHGFKKLDYLTMGNKINKDSSEEYKAKELFED
ncbi:MAG: LemA family protein [Nanoarchaeota archaeon]|nr:LemA family protein [Nanoarchaeota archaeon]MBU4116353.1 LemA family protein [Nanoarchaeota archaeon]